MQETEIQTICRTIAKEGWYKGFDGGPFDPPVAVKGARRRKGQPPSKSSTTRSWKATSVAKPTSWRGYPAARIRSRWISFRESSPGRPRTDPIAGFGRHYARPLPQR